MRNLFKKAASAGSLGLMLAGLMLSSAPSAHACSCMMPPAPKEALEESDAVFAGTVTSFVPADGGQKRVATFDVDRSWKGVDQKTVAISTARDSAACGIDFQVGMAYVVYARESEGGDLGVTLCTGTHAISAASIDSDEDAKALGDATIVLQDKPEPHESAMASGAVTLVVGLVAVVAGISAAKLVRSRRSGAGQQ